MKTFCYVHRTMRGTFNLFIVKNLIKQIVKNICLYILNKEKK